MPKAGNRREAFLSLCSMLHGGSAQEACSPMPAAEMRPEERWASSSKRSECV